MGLFGRSKTPEIPSLEAVVHAFGKCLETRKTVVCDVSELPYEKEVIKLALTKAIALTSDPTMKEQLCTGLVSLADFQNIHACNKYGLRPEKMMVWEGEALLTLARST